MLINDPDCGCASTRCADCSAFAFLWKHLTRSQRRSMRLDHEFRVRGSLTRKIYNIGFDGVERIGDGHCFCLTVRGGVPTGDELLAKKILIENDEKLFLQTANESDSWGDYVTPRRRYGLNPKTELRSDPGI